MGGRAGKRNVACTVMHVRKIENTEEEMKGKEVKGDGRNGGKGYARRRKYILPALKGISFCKVVFVL